MLLAVALLQRALAMTLFATYAGALLMHVLMRVSEV